jgi:hypothetical protein
MSKIEPKVINQIFQIAIDYSRQLVTLSNQKIFCRYFRLKISITTQRLTSDEDCFCSRSDGIIYNLNGGMLIAGASTQHRAGRSV